MTTYIGDSSELSYSPSYSVRPHPSNNMVASPETSNPASAQVGRATNNVTTPIPSSKLLERLQDKVQKFPTRADLKRAIELRIKNLEAGKTTDQYLVFKPVTEVNINNIDRHHVIGRNIRVTYCKDLQTLILKVPTFVHESAHGEFASKIVIRSALMGLERELAFCGATRYQGRDAEKEANSAYKPRSLRPLKTDWPTIVLESGVSESLPQLRTDVSWWLSNSGGDVKIVLIFSVTTTTRTIHIEKWENTPAPVTRPHTRLTPSGTLVPTSIQQIDISPSGVQGSPLILHFDKIFLRLPNPHATPAEHDLIFTAQDLQTYATDLWNGAQ